MRLAAIGDNCVDFYEKQGWAYPGGNAVNVASTGDSWVWMQHIWAGSAQTILVI